MRIACVKTLLLFAVALAIVVLVSLDAVAQSATLFSPNRYLPERRQFCITFADNRAAKNQSSTAQVEVEPSGAPIELRHPGRPSGPTQPPCDVTYGTLWVGDQLDWFKSSGARGDRSVIKDLGSYNWTEAIKVPVVAALPKLKPGEVRTVNVSADGADGADGSPGVRGADGADGIDGAPGENADGSMPESSGTRPARPSQPDPPQVTPRPKHDGKPKVDPIFVKAVVGHMYVIHVVDDTRDFYALFRVDELVRGDRCVVSWKLIDAPTEGPK